MAQDWDFRKQVKEPPRQYQSVQRKAPKRPSKKMGILPLIFMVVGIGLIVWAVLTQYSQPNTSPASSSSETTSTSEETPQRDLAEIKVYDGGAGEQSSKEVVAKLQGADFQAVYLGRSLDSYVGVEIWYSSEYRDLAAAVAETIANPITSQNLAKASGNYSVLIFVGR